MAFKVQKAVREKIFVKIALMGASGAGKSYSALKLATGMTDELEKMNKKEARILLANTEDSRGRYYADEFEYDIVDIEPPHNPEKYVELINFAVDEGYDVLIIDSTSHEWEGQGGCLELQQKAGGNYQAWSKVTPRHNAFIEAIASSPIHIIATMRGKDQYVMESDDKNKTQVKKLGVGAKQRDGFEYEFSCTFLIDQKTHMAETQKDNSHLFEGSIGTLLTEDHGRKIIQWANSGEGYTPKVKKPATTSNPKDVVDKISAVAKDAFAKGVDRDAFYGVVEEICGTKSYNKVADVELLEKTLEAVKKLNV